MRCTRSMFIVAPRWCGLVTMLAMISVSTGYGTDGSSTPTMVAVPLLNRIGLPITDGIAVEKAGPEAMRQHHHARRLPAVVRGIQQPAQHRPQAHHLEVRPAHDAGVQQPRLAGAQHREIDGREIAKGADGGGRRLDVVVFRHRERHVRDAEARRALADVDEAILAAIDQRAQQHAADHAEDRGVGADAEGEGDHDGGGQALGAQEGAEADPHVLRRAP